MITKILISKGLRTFISGAVAVIIGIYLADLHLNAIFVGLAVLFLYLGGAISSLLMNYFSKLNTLVLLYSFLAVLSGFLLFLFTSPIIILISLLISNISNTGTETSIFQAIDVSIIPDLVKKKELTSAFSTYNFIGYLFTSFGMLFSGIIPNNPTYLKYLFLGISLVGIINIIVYRSLHKSVSTISINRKVRLTRDAKMLLGLFSLDAFAGSFVPFSLISYWFYFAYKSSLSFISIILFVSNILTSLSLYITRYIARIFGTLNTMVFAHLISNIFLIAVPFGGSAMGSGIILFMRQLFSQMDVPTRQKLISDLFSKKLRTRVNSLGNTIRVISAIPGPYLVGDLLSIGFLSFPFILSGILKSSYDISIFYTFHKKYKEQG